MISQDVGIAAPVGAHAEVKRRLVQLEGLLRSPDEPSVWLPASTERIEVNFIGYHPDGVDPTSVHVLEDDTFPLMVFGPISFLRPGRLLDLGEGLEVPLPRNAGLCMEKLVTDRSGTKGDRDLLVSLGLLIVADAQDRDELVALYGTLPDELRDTVLSNLFMSSLLGPSMGCRTRRRRSRG